METRNRRVKPRGNSGTSFPHSLPSHVSEVPSETVETAEVVEVADVTAVVEDVEVVSTEVCRVLPPSLEVVDSVQKELLLVVWVE